MKLLGGLFLACLLVAAPYARAADEADVDEKDVIVLTDKNFKDTLAKHKYALIEFYAPWCGHCKNLKPAYAEAATKLKEYDENIAIAKLDATEEKDTAGQFGIKGFPTLKWFVDGEEAMDYSGGRSAAEIVAWVKKKTGPPSTTLDDTAAFDKAKEENVAVFAYFEKFEGDDHAAFESLASKTDDASFFKTTNADVAKALGLEKPGYAVGRNYPEFGFESAVAEGHEAFKGDGSLADKLSALLKAEKLPAFIEFSPATSQRIFGAGIDHQVIITGPADIFAKDADFHKELVAASKATKGKVVWVSATVDASTAEPIINYFGLDKASKEPQVVGFMSQGGKKYAFYEGEKPTAANLEKFALAVVEGTAPRRTKSAEIPAEPLDEGVTVVVGKNFEQIVKDPTKDVLLEVYAPWCGHCKALAPTYVKLAKRFKDIDSVVIAKMDGTENEVADVEVQGYPTLLFFPAEKDAKPIAYDQGGRELKDLTKFIKAHAKVEYELPKKGEKKSEEEAAEEKEADKDAAADADDDEDVHDEL